MVAGVVANRLVLLNSIAEDEVGHRAVEHDYNYLDNWPGKRLDYPGFHIDRTSLIIGFPVSGPLESILAFTFSLISGETDESY